MNKGKLTDQEEKIRNYIKRYNGESIVLIVADYDRDDDPLNKVIISYCEKQHYELVWMNKNVEDVFIRKIVKARDKGRAALDFLKNKDAILSKLTNLSNINVLKNEKSSNLLVVLDKYIKRK